MNLHAYTTKFLKSGEVLRSTVHRSVIGGSGSGLFGALLVIADFFWLARWVAWREWGMVGFAVVLGLGLAVIARAWYMWSWNVFVITNRRVVSITQRGWFHRSVAEAAYENIQDVRYTVHGLIQTVTRTGTVIVQTAAGTTSLELKGVARPADLQELITDIQRESRRDQAGGDVSHMLKAVEQLRTTYPETWERVRRSNGGKKHAS